MFEIRVTCVYTGEVTLSHYADREEAEQALEDYSYDEAYTAKLTEIDDINESYAYFAGLS